MINDKIETLLDLDELLSATNGMNVLGSGDFCFTNVQTDSRNVTEKSLFVPLVGEKQDGHSYVPQAVEKGASVVFISLQSYEKDSEFFVNISLKNPNVFFIAVENTLYALQKAAGKYVQKFDHLIKIAVTGSSGKTTTKEIAFAILSQKYNVIANKGNLNSETGLPLSVFEIRKEHQVGLFEMGMNRKGEMAEIASVLKPRFAIITNIGTAHIGILGSRKNIAEEKAQVFNHFNNFGTAVIPAEDDFAEYLASCVEGKVVFYGKDKPDFIQFVEDKGLDGTQFLINGKKALLPLPGSYNYRNALAAITLAKVLDVSDEQIICAMESMKPLFARSEVIRNTYTIIQDCYNANPDSMEKALDFVSSIKCTCKRIYVLGDMLELGEESVLAHKKIGKLAVKSNADVVVFVGKEMKAAYEQATLENTSVSLRYIESYDENSAKKIAEAVKEFAVAGDIILLKGSRGIGLERVTKLLLEVSK